MDKIKEIYEKIKLDIDMLKEISINKMYDDFFSKSKRRKEIIDSSLSKEVGMRKIIGDSYYYSMLEDNIMLLLDPYISNNNSSNKKVSTWISSPYSPVIIPNREYKRLSRLDLYRLHKKYIDGSYKRLDVFDPEPRFDDECILDDEYKEPLLYDEIEEIQKVISKLDKCNYLGFFGYYNGDFHELYEYNDSILYDFTAIFASDKLMVTKLEISKNI